MIRRFLRWLAEPDVARALAQLEAHCAELEALLVLEREARREAEATAEALRLHRAAYGAREVWG